MAKNFFFHALGVLCHFAVNEAQIDTAQQVLRGEQRQSPQAAFHGGFRQTLTKRSSRGYPLIHPPVLLSELRPPQGVWSDTIIINIVAGGRDITHDTLYSKITLLSISPYASYKRSWRRCGGKSLGSGKNSPPLRKLRQRLWTRLEPRRRPCERRTRR